jgi:hypothetical protein
MKNFIIFLFLFVSLAANASKRADIVQSLFRVVEEWMGTPYELGSKDKSGIDCSGFTSTVYSEVFKIELPRSVSSQKQLGDLVKDKLQPGDLIFFNIDGKISHVGVYVFDNKFIHAASAGPEVGVIKSSLNENYYKTRFAYAKRVVTLPEYEKPDLVKNDSSSDVDIKLELVFGKTLYRNRIIDESSVFTSDKPVFFKIKSLDNIPGDFTIQFENQSTATVEKSWELQMIDRDINKKIDLNKGRYNVKVMKNDTLVVREEITVN